MAHSQKKKCAEFKLVNVQIGITAVLVLLIVDANLSISGTVAILLPPPLSIPIAIVAITIIE